MSPPSKRVTIPDAIIIVCTGALGIFGGELWTALLCGIAMAICIAAWRILWYLGSLHESWQVAHDEQITDREGHA